MTLKAINKNSGIEHFTVIKILKKFSSQEMNEFEKMINSPFFNNNSTLARLFKVLKKYYPNFSVTEITKEKLFSSATNGKKYDDKLFRKYLSLINKMAEEYLYIIDSRKYTLEKDIKILAQLSGRDIEDAFDRKVHSIEKSISKTHKIDAYGFFLDHNLNVIKYNHKSLHNKIRPNSEELLNSYINLIYYFIFNSASILNQLDSDHYSFRIFHDSSGFIDLFDKNKLEEYILSIKKFIQPKEKNNLLFLEIMLNDLEMDSSESGLTAYRNLYRLVYENSKKFSREMLFYYLQRMIVYCTLENIKGKYNLTREIFDSYKFQVENNLHSIEGSINLNFLNFRSIVTSALKNNEFEWAEEFINENIHKVKEESRTNILNYTKAMISFYKNEFNESLNFITKINQESLPISIDIYILKIKIFYKLGYRDSVRSVSDTFRHFIKGNKLISDYHKNTLINFLKYFRIIFRLSMKPDNVKLNEVIDRIQSSIDTKERKWMIEIANELLLQK